jgi:hypothetical protein
VLKPNGLLLLRVPAHDWLRGEHDRLVHTRHRYGRQEVDDKLRAAGFEVEQLSWANAVLFPAAAAKRLLERRRGLLGLAASRDLHRLGRAGLAWPGGLAGDRRFARERSEQAPRAQRASPASTASKSREHSEPEPDLWMPPAPLNWLLQEIVELEALALPRQWPVPFGLSLIALARAA